MSATFDPDIVAVLKAEAGDNTKSKLSSIDDLTKLTGRTFKYDAHNKKMSTVFGWKPVLGVDFPVPVFKDKDWPKEVRCFIPDADKLKGYVPYEPLVEKFIAGMFHEDRILLHGPTGPGKSTLPEYICSVLRIPYLIDNGHSEKEKSEFIGINSFKIDPDTGKEVLGAEDTMWTLAFRHGGMMVYDEVFRSPPGVNMVIQAAMEKGGALILQDAAGVTSSERKLTPPPNKFWFVLTDNSSGTGDTTGNYVTQTQDVSTLDRITSTIYVDYLPEKYELAIIQAQEPSVDEAQGVAMIQIAGLIRAAFNNGNLMQTMSVRGLLSWASKAVTYGNLDRGFILSFYDKLGDSSEKDVILEIWHQVLAQHLEIE